MAIEGIKLSITSAELKKLCEQRVEYHSKRAEQQAERLKKLEPTFKEIEQEDEESANEAAHGFKYASSNAPGDEDPLAKIRRRFKHHRDRATVFRFMAEHVVVNETYVMTESDLQKLEVIKPSW